MNNTIKIFEHEDFGRVRTIEESGTIYFCGSDVAKALGYEKPNNALKAHCLAPTLKRSMGVRTATSADGTAIIQDVDFTFIRESDVYRLILRSKLPKAQQFERWVMEDILPSVVRHGVYAVDELLNDPDTLIKTLEALKKERAEKALLQKEVAAMKPKALFAEVVEASDSTILIGELAKILKGHGVEIGQNRLFEKLRQEGYLVKRQGTDYNAPTQRAMELGLFKVKETAITHADGHVSINKTTKVTGKGQTYFINKFLGSVAC